jgi:multidrug efflux pump
MKISDLCIRRPVFATVLSLAIMLVGLVSYTRLPVREYPKIDEPVVTVDTTYRGASAEIVESQISKPLEDSLAGIEGVDVITSISRQENSQISVRFKLERNPDSAASDVRDRVSRVRNKLPTDIDEPVIAKVEADANPIIWIAFSSDQHSALEVTDVANRIVKPRLQTLPGAADVRVFGERKFAMRIWLDRDRLAAFNLTPQDVEDALRRQNVEVPAGRIESESREFSVVARTDLTEPAQFAEIIVKQAADARAATRCASPTSAGSRSAPPRSAAACASTGRPAVALGVIKQATANPLELSRALRAELPKVISELPPGMTANVAYDSSVFIDRSIDAVFKTIGEAMLLVLLIIFFFLRNFRATLIPLVTIPVSLIGAFALMLVLGFTINTLTLLALVLAIGLVVDDAIVVLENIYRHIEAGHAAPAGGFPGRAGDRLRGRRDDHHPGRGVCAGGLHDRAHRQAVRRVRADPGRGGAGLGLRRADAVADDVLAAAEARDAARQGLLWVENFLNGMTAGYRRLLTAALARRWLVMLAFALVAGANVLLLGALKSELAPIEDRGVIIGVFLGPEGATLDYTDRYATQLEDIYAKTPDIERYFVVSGNPTVSQGISFVGLPTGMSGQRNSAAVVKELFPKFMGIPGVLAFPVLPPSLGQSPRERPVNFVIVTSASYAELEQMTGRILDEVAKNPGFTNVDTDLKLNKPELSVIVNRDKAMDTGVQIETVGRTLETMLGGRQVTRFKREGEQYDVIVQVADIDRATPSDIRDIFVRAKDGSMIPLANLLTVDETVSPRELNHFGQRRAVTITANLTPGYAMGEALSSSKRPPGACCRPATRSTMPASRASSSSRRRRWR